MRIHVINGPNLNLLSRRDERIYGSFGYEDVVSSVKKWCDDREVEVNFFQSNHEGKLVDYIQAIPDGDAIVINPGAFAHYSYALRDALEMFFGPKVEVHISNIFKREDFRTKSVTAPVCDGLISGLGLDGYVLAVRFVLKKLLHN